MRSHLVRYSIDGLYVVVIYVLEERGRKEETVEAIHLPHLPYILNPTFVHLFDIEREEETDVGSGEKIGECRRNADPLVAAATETEWKEEEEKVIRCCWRNGNVASHHPPERSSLALVYLNFLVTVASICSLLLVIY